MSACYSFSTQAALEKCVFPDENKENTPEVQKAPKAPKFKFSEEEYRNAKPFNEIPGPSRFKLLMDIILPGGKYFRKNMLEMQRLMQQEYGSLVRFPSMLGKEPMYMLFDATEIETVLRNEGPWPYRRTLEIFDLFRKNERPDLFDGMAGLIQE